MKVLNKHGLADWLLYIYPKSTILLPRNSNVKPNNCNFVNIHSTEGTQTIQVEFHINFHNICM